MIAVVVTDNVYAVDSLGKALVRIRTNELYSQIKYNLWREESEGYSKLIVELVTYFSSTTEHSGIMIQHIKKLIGYFDLDPNRCIDIILYIYSQYLTIHNIQAFISLISIYDNSNITQIIGFILQSHNSTKTFVDTNYYHAIVLLIMHNILNIKDIYTHLSPTDEWLQTARQHAVTDAQQQAKKVNQVSLVSTDTTDTKQPIRTQPGAAATGDNIDESVHIPPEQQLGYVLSSTVVHNITLEHGASVHGTIDVVTNKQNQKLQLLRWLLYHGAYNYAHVFLSHLLDVVPCSDMYVGQAMIHYINHLVEPVYNNTQSTSIKSILTQSDTKHQDDFTLFDLSSTATIQQLSEWQSQQNDIDRQHHNNTSTYHTTLSTLLPLFEYLGPYLCNNTLLFERLCKIVVLAIKHEQSTDIDMQVNSNTDHWTHDTTTTKYTLSPLLTTYIKYIILPAYTLSVTTTAITYDIWSIFSLLSYEQRFELYGYWRNVLYDDIQYPELNTVKQHTINKTKYYRKRLSTNNLKEMARLLLKFSTHNPTHVFELLLQQVQSFDNMIIPVVEALKYQSKLCTDILCWTLLTQLSADKSKMKSDGINESHWYQSLCTFTGSLFKRYPELTLQPFIDYCIKQYINDQAVDVLLLKELLSNMTGIDQYEESSDTVIDARTGGRLLNSETVNTKTVIKNKHRSVRYMLQSLISDTTQPKNLLFTLYVLLCQLEGTVSHSSEIEDIRTTTSVVDKIHEILIQFIDFVDIAITDNNTFIQYIPSIYSMITDYKLSVERAFYLARRAIAYVRIHSVDYTDTTQVTCTQLVPTPLIDMCNKLHSDTLWHSITPLLYTTFWSLSITNVYVPISQYDTLINKYKTQVASYDGKTLDSTQSKEFDRLKSLVDKLTAEKQKQQQQYNSVVNQLKQQRDQYLHNIQQRTSTLQTIFSYCILPRLLTSAIDAIYCAKFIQLMHTVNVPYFNIVLLYDLIIRNIGTIICSTTFNESRRLSIFLIHMLTFINQFTSDQKYYETHCMSTAGFSRTVDNTNTSKVSYKEIVVLVKRWYDRLTTVFVRILNDGTPTERTNVLLILTKINTQYPRYMTQNQQLETAVGKLMQEQEKQSALKLMSTRVHAMLQQSKKSVIDDTVKSTAATNSTAVKTNGTTTTTKPVVVTPSQSKPNTNGKFEPAHTKSVDIKPTITQTPATKTSTTKSTVSDKAQQALNALVNEVKRSASNNTLNTPQSNNISKQPSNNTSNRPTAQPATNNYNNTQRTGTPPMVINRTESRGTNPPTIDIRRNQPADARATNDNKSNVRTQPVDNRRQDTHTKQTTITTQSQPNNTRTANTDVRQPIRTDDRRAEPHHNKSDDRSSVRIIDTRQPTTPEDKYTGKRGRQPEPVQPPRGRDVRPVEPPYNDNRRPSHHTPQPQHSPDYNQQQARRNTRQRRQ